jgi:hypothetical protein
LLTLTFLRIEFHIELFYYLYKISHPKQLTLLLFSLVSAAAASKTNF